MNYTEKIEQIIAKVNKKILDLSVGRVKSTPPTQVSSEFLTNKEQGDWAEETLLEAINHNANELIAVKYGRGDDIIAGEEGFKEFYNHYQNELDTVGKRPDLLIFDKKDFPYDTKNISDFPLEELDKIVPKAKCGIEVRSSAFLINQYEAYMESRNDILINHAMQLKAQILKDYSELLKEKDSELFHKLDLLNEENIHDISYKVPAWRRTKELSELSSLLRELKEVIGKVQKRSFLSITPKIEDLKVVYNWIKRYHVPHYYVQVFFDKAYGISYEKILTLLANESLEKKEYFIESDVKNQNKTTVKIRANDGENILTQIDLPEHESQTKELGRGRLLFYVKFKKSKSVMNKEAFKNLFGFELK